MRLRRAVGLAVAVGVGALLPLASAAEAITFSNTTPISIPPAGPDVETQANPYPSTISVSGLTGTVTDVNVTLCGFSATFPSDVDVMLVAPNGTSAVIMSDVGGDGEVDPVAENVTLTLDDAAASRLPADTALSTGTFRPLDDDSHDFDPDFRNVDLFHAPAPVPNDPVGVFRPSNGVWFFRSDTDNVQLSAFNGVNPNGTWSLYVMDDVAGGPDDQENVLPNFSCGWSLDITAGGTGVPPGNGTAVQWGTNGDIPVPGDYDGNGSIDIAVYRPSNGVWFIQGGATVQWGTAGDIPVPGDYDGNGSTDIAVFRPSNGAWFIQGGTSVIFGINGDVPVPADYDGDDDTDIAVFRPSNGTWFFRGPLADETLPLALAWGTNGDIPVPGDYDGDGLANIAVFRPSTGHWFIRLVGIFLFGTNGDIPVPADYDNDGDTDIAVFRPSSGTWFIRNGATVQFGLSGDVPLAVPPAVKTLFFP